MGKNGDPKRHFEKAKAPFVPTFSPSINLKN